MRDQKPKRADQPNGSTGLVDCEKELITDPEVLSLVMVSLPAKFQACIAKLQTLSIQLLCRMSLPIHGIAWMIPFLGRTVPVDFIRYHHSWWILDDGQ